MPVSGQAVESSIERAEITDVRLADVLLDGGELAFGVRLRIAIDVLQDAASRGAKLARRPKTGGMRLEEVFIDGAGIARHRGENATGVAELTWEILAGRPLKGTAILLGQVVDDMTE